MAHNNIEIEIKIKLTNEQHSSIKEKLKTTASFVKSSDQKDEYFTPLHRNFMAEKFPFEWLSIRERAGKIILNYKHWHPKGSEVHTHCDEFETTVGEKSQIEKIFSALDIKPIALVEKHRETYSTDDFEIALDTVKDLGYYIEIEASKSLGDIETTLEKLNSFAKSLGLDTTKADKKGYPYAILEKNGLIKSFK